MFLPVQRVKWSSVASMLPGRLGKQCRERWFNHLDPSVKKSEWTSREDEVLFNSQVGFFCVQEINTEERLGCETRPCGAFAHAARLSCRRADPNPTPRHCNYSLNRSRSPHLLVPLSLRMFSGTRAAASYTRNTKALTMRLSFSFAADVLWHTHCWLCRLHTKKVTMHVF